MSDYSVYSFFLWIPRQVWEKTRSLQPGNVCRNTTRVSDSSACLPRRGWAGCWQIWIRGSSCRCTQRRHLQCVCSLTRRSRWKDTEPRSSLCRCSGDCQTRWVLNRTKEKSISSSLGRNFSPLVVETTKENRFLINAKLVSLKAETYFYHEPVSCQWWSREVINWHTMSRSDITILDVQQVVTSWQNLRCYTCHCEDDDAEKQCVRTPTISFPIFRWWWPRDGLQVAQLPAHHLSGVEIEVVIADGAPFTVVENLHAALVVFPLVSRQSELNPRRVRCQLRGGVLLRHFRVGVARRVAEVLVLGESQL